jgi:hypothetical protein
MCTTKCLNDAFARRLSLHSDSMRQRLCSFRLGRNAAVAACSSNQSSNCALLCAEQEQLFSILDFKSYER